MTCVLKIRLHTSYDAEYLTLNFLTPWPLFHVCVMITVKKLTLNTYYNVNELADRPDVLHSSGGS